MTRAGSAHGGQLTADSTFVMWFGGPGIYDPLDTDHHDSAWYNYLYTIFLLCNSGKLPKLKSEKKIIWGVYAPAYRVRWSDDEKSKDPTIKKHVQDVKDRGSKDYLDHIGRNVAGYNKKWGYNIELQKIEEGRLFWDIIHRLPDHTLSRVWYFGHACKELWLCISHDSSHKASSPPEGAKGMIQLEGIQGNKGHFADRFADKSRASKFYGCNTKEFAHTWFTTFDAKAEGTCGKINFQKIGLKELESSVAEGWASYVP